MSTAGDALAGLRDIHLPPPVPWWPPAPGWWALAAAIALVTVAFVWWVVRRRRHTAPQRAARREMARLLGRHRESGDDAAFAAGLSRLVRRCALARFPREQVAALTGDAWLEFLDATGGAGGFARGPGRALIRAPYRAGEPVDSEALACVVHSWLGAMSRSRGIAR